MRPDARDLNELKDACGLPLTPGLTSCGWGCGVSERDMTFRSLDFNVRTFWHVRRPRGAFDRVSQWRQARQSAIRGPQPHHQFARYGALPRAGGLTSGGHVGKPLQRAICYICLDVEP